MKKHFFYLIALGALAFTGCEKDESKPAELPGAAGAVTMTVQDDGSVMLSIKPVANAKIYHWYLNNDIVQNTSDTTYLANVSGTYKVAGVNSDSKEGVACTPVNVIVGLPGAAGDISQKLQSDGYTLLTIAEIPRADTYRWYKGDKEVQNTDSRTFLVTESGSYRVAGVNKDGEGAYSKPLLVEREVFNILTKEHIPSDIFRSWIKDNIAGGSAEFTNFQAAEYTGTIDITYLQAPSLKGIEYFTSLSRLNCMWNLLTELDVSKNVNLTYLNCNTNAITALDISKLTKLDTLNISYNKIKSLDFSGCKESLRSLIWANSKLTVADFAATNIKTLTNLGTLNISINKFSDGTLDLSGMSSVEYIDLTYCSLSSINLNGCSNLKKLVVGSNSLTSLDLSGCPILEGLYCQNNSGISTLPIDHLTATLKVLNFNTCNVSYVDFSKFTKLEYVECQSNPWQGSLDFSKCTELTGLRCEEMGISNLNVSTCTKLQELYAYSNNLTGLDLSACSSLTQLYVSNNQLTALNISGCNALGVLYVYSNQLTSIDISNNKGLTDFFCSNNNLGSRLDISNNSALVNFSCTGNDNLQQIKVWSTFDMATTYFEKPSTAAWVYEFTK